MTTITIKCLTPNDFEVTMTEEVAPEQSEEYLLTWDKWLKSNGFKPLPVPKSGGGNWNKDGKSNTPRNWIEAEGNSLYVYFAWQGKDKAENDANKKAWLEKIQAATGVMGTTEHELFGKDSKGRDIWTYVYPVVKGRELLEVLPVDQFERRPKLQSRLDAASQQKK